MQHPSKKNVIMLVIDSLMDDSIQPVIESGKAPALKFFKDNGHYYPQLICPFPSMSVNVASSMLTGVYCDKHHVPGLVWYDLKEKRIVNYGSSKKEMFALGVGQSLHDMVYNLNHVHLNKDCQTIHEALNEKGIQTASINGIVYRGKNTDHLKMPFLLSTFTGIDKHVKTWRPRSFSYGFFNRLTSFKENMSIWPMYGFNDRFSVNELTYLIRKNKLSPFTIAYFPDLDKRLHKNGRHDDKAIEKVDKKLQRILNTYASWEGALRDNIWIVMGDNGHASVDHDLEKARIDLRNHLSQYQIVQLGKPVRSDDDIVLAVNGRMAYIYTLDHTKASLQEIAAILKEDERIDVIGFRDGETITVMSGTHDGELHYHSEGDAVDCYGQSWFIDGNNNILDLEIDDNLITYGDYPDGLARLYTSLVSHEGYYLAVTAKPGYEFKGERSPIHAGGGSHGGLHKHDSSVAMMVCGTNTAPAHLRTIDIKDWVVSLASDANTDDNQGGK